MTVAGCPAFSSCLGKDGFHPVSHMIPQTWKVKLTSYVHMVKGLVFRTFPLLCMPVWHGAWMQEYLLYLINAGTGAILVKVMYCNCVLWNSPFCDLITFTQSLILSHFYVFVTINNYVLEVLN